MRRMNIILVTHYFPPELTAGSNRPYQVARYMLQKGRNVVIVKSGISSSGLGLEERFWRPHRIAALLEKAAYAFFGLVGIYLPQRRSWKGFAMRQADELIRGFGGNTVELYCTYPVAEALEIGLALKRKYPGIRFTAEFRDGLYTEAIEGPKTRFLWGARLAYRRLEATILREADTVISVSAILAAKLKSAGPGRDILTAMNGFESSDQGEPRGDAARDLKAEYPGKTVILHSGSIVRKEKNFIALCAMVSALNEKLEKKMLLAQVGDAPAKFMRRALAAFPGAVVFVPAVKRDVAIAYQKSADALIILNITGETREGVLTGKLFEYLFAGVPIVSFLPGTEAAAVIDRTGTGLSIDYRSDQAVEALRMVAAGEFTYEPKHLEDYLFKRQIEGIGEYWDD